MKAFDLASYELKDTSQLTIKLPSGDDMLVEGKKVIFTLYGSGSPQYVSAKHKYDTTMQTKLAQLVKTGKGGNTAQEAEMKADFYASCTASIENFPLDADAIYKNPKLGYILRQVETFLNDEANFLPT